MIRGRLGASIVGLFIVAACEAGITTSAFDQQSDMLESWRPTPLRPDPSVIAAGEAACRERQDGGDLPLVVTDARGERRIQFVFADDTSVAICRYWLNDDGSISIDLSHGSTRDPVGDDDDDDEITIEYSAGTGFGRGDDSWEEQLVVGRADPSVESVSIRPRGEPPLVASLNDGWYAAWWPKLHTPHVVEALDSTGSLLASDSVGFGCPGGVCP